MSVRRSDTGRIDITVTDWAWGGFCWTVTVVGIPDPDPIPPRFHGVAYIWALWHSLLQISWVSLVEHLAMGTVCGSDARRRHVNLSPVIVFLHEAWPVFLASQSRLGASHPGPHPTSPLGAQVLVLANRTFTEDVASASSCQVAQLRSLSMCQPIPGQFATREDVVVAT